MLGRLDSAWPDLPIYHWKLAKLAASEKKDIAIGHYSAVLASIFLQITQYIDQQCCQLEFISVVNSAAGMPIQAPWA